MGRDMNTDSRKEGVKARLWRPGKKKFRMITWGFGIVKGTKGTMGVKNCKKKGLGFPLG